MMKIFVGGTEPARTFVARLDYFRKFFLQIFGFDSSHDPTGGSGLLFGRPAPCAAAPPRGTLMRPVMTRRVGLSRKGRLLSTSGAGAPRKRARALRCPTTHFAAIRSRLPMGISLTYPWRVSTPV
jgi:hypothetical protein